jgi:hypothetical protein
MPRSVTDLIETVRYDPTPELTADYSRRDLIHALEDLRFKKNGSATIRLDRPVRDFIVARLTDRP